MNSEFNIREYLSERHYKAVLDTPAGFELVGWLIFGEDRISRWPLLDPLARPVYALKKEFE